MGSVTYRTATGASEGQAARWDRRTTSAPAICSERAAASRSTSDEADWLHSSSAVHHRLTRVLSSSPNLPQAREGEGIQAHFQLCPGVQRPPAALRLQNAGAKLECDLQTRSGGCFQHSLRRNLEGSGHTPWQWQGPTSG